MPTLVGSSTAPGSASSSATFTTAQTPGGVGAQAGDLLLAIGGHERTGVPTLGGVAGLTTVRAEGAVEPAVVIGWKRLVAADLTTAVVMSTAAGATRRGMVAFVVLREAADPVFVHGPMAGGQTGQTTANHPAGTPVAADALVVSLLLAISNVTPYARTFTPAAGWTEDVEAGSTSTAAINAFTVIGHRAGGAGGVAVPGNVVTADAEKFLHWPSTVVVEHQPAQVATGDGWPSWLPRLSGQALVQVLVPDGAWTPPPTDPEPEPVAASTTAYPGDSLYPSDSTYPEA